MVKAAVFAPLVIHDSVKYYVNLACMTRLNLAYRRIPCRLKSFINPFLSAA